MGSMWWEMDLYLYLSQAIVMLQESKSVCLYGDDDRSLSGEGPFAISTKKSFFFFAMELLKVNFSLLAKKTQYLDKVKMYFTYILP